MGNTFSSPSASSLSHVPLHPDSVDLQYKFPGELWDQKPKPPQLGPNGEKIIKSKRLIVCCDGTWQKADGLLKKEDLDPSHKNPITDRDSNVARFYKCLDVDTPVKTYDEQTKITSIITQQAIYIGGLGTRSLWDKFIGGAFGRGIDKNIFTGYEWLCKNYNEGDEIFFVGFSRGAYTARSLAGIVHDVGLLMIKDPDEFKKAWDEIFDAYRTSGEWDKDFHTRAQNRQKAFRTYMETKGYRFPLFINVPIMGIGVWDTVGALGIPTRQGGLLVKIKRKLHLDYNRRYEFHNTAIGHGYRYAFHAMALDEERYAFRPTQWYFPGDFEPVPENEYDPTNGVHRRRQALANSRAPFLMQCWFPGVHIDCGGGTSKGAYPQLSDLTLMCMIRRFNDLGSCGKHTLKFNEETIDSVIQDSWKRPYSGTKKTKLQSVFSILDSWYERMTGTSFILYATGLSVTTRMSVTPAHTKWPISTLCISIKYAPIFKIKIKLHRYRRLKEDLEF